MGVNLWGVIHGVRTFVPIMLDQGTECHVVNTASVAGLLSLRGYGVYGVTKHGVVTLSATLHHELAHKEAKVKVSVLCPGVVKTKLHWNSAKVKPAEYQVESPGTLLTAEEQDAKWKRIAETYRVLPVEAVVEAVFTAIREEQFYVLTHPKTTSRVRARMVNIINERNPVIPGP